MNESAPQGEPVDCDYCESTGLDPEFPTKSSCPVCYGERAAPQAAPSVAARHRAFALFRQRPDENEGREFFHCAMWHNETAPGQGERVVSGWFVLYAGLTLPAVVQVEPSSTLEYVKNYVQEREDWPGTEPLIADIDAAIAALRHQAAPGSTQPAAPQLDTQRATEGMPAPVEPVAWLSEHYGGSPVVTEDFLRAHPEYRHEYNIPLYRTPQAVPATASPVAHPAGERTASSEGPREGHSGYGERPNGKDGASPPVQQGVVEALDGLYNAMRDCHYGRMPERVKTAYDNAATVLARVDAGGAAT